MGRVQGRCFSIKTLREWDAHDIAPLVQSLLEVELLANRWIHLKFMAVGDAKVVEEKAWHIDFSPIIFKFWSPLFNAHKEWFDLVPLWV